MISRKTPEFREVQQSAIDLLVGLFQQDGFRVEHRSGTEIDAERSGETETLLVERPGRRRRVINSWLSDNGVRQAIDALRQPLARGLGDANETCHQLLSRWLTVDEFQNGRPTNRSVWFFDFDKPQNNDLDATE